MREYLPLAFQDTQDSGRKTKDWFGMEVEANGLWTHAHCHWHSLFANLCTNGVSLFLQLYGACLCQWKKTDGHWNNIDNTTSFCDVSLPAFLLSSALISQIYYGEDYEDPMGTSWASQPKLHDAWGLLNSRAMRESHVWTWFSPCGLDKALPNLTLFRRLGFSSRNVFFSYEYVHKGGC